MTVCLMLPCHKKRLTVDWLIQDGQCVPNCCSPPSPKSWKHLTIQRQGVSAAPLLQKPSTERRTLLPQSPRPLTQYTPSQRKWLLLEELAQEAVVCRGSPPRISCNPLVVDFVWISGNVWLQAGNPFDLAGMFDYRRGRGYHALKASEAGCALLCGPCSRHASCKHVLPRDQLPRVVELEIEAFMRTFPGACRHL